ncbi:MAG: serine/threonine phosphatase [Symploca sp. SIO1C4]|uniref:Serine/threonine phosphatase n=1 Tax=Symploca sp. SIO1C4 TaxID=2607765 RepID=A0A6B3N9K8_9CYAN|nr:serine/threonine phosphatase [Symploca sp. SIO1C4]
MLICPDCHFENPDTNNFCQRCGTSLTHKTCYQCSAQVPVDAATCHNCGAFTGTVWRAIICQDPNFLPSSQSRKTASFPTSQLVAENTDLVESSQLQISQESPKAETDSIKTPLLAWASNTPLIDSDAQDLDSPKALATNESVSSQSVEAPLSSQLSSNPGDQEQFSQTSNSLENNQNETFYQIPPSIVYLDPQQRYRVLELKNIEKIRASLKLNYSNAEVCNYTTVGVLDCQPFQISLLDVLVKQQQGVANHYEFLDKGEATNDELSTEQADTWKINGIPEIAKPYLALQESCYPTIPSVHDAWQQDGEAVVLLEDRSRWRLLSDLWLNEQFSPLQTIYWLDEMARLWEALEPLHCRQSLLEITNLRVDEDQVLGLVHLYPEVPGQEVTLKDLGKTWQLLFDQSQRTQFTSLRTIFRNLCDQEMITVLELRSHLQEIASELQMTLPTTSSDAGAFPEQSEPFNSEMGTVNFQSEGDDLPTVILPMQLLSLDDAGCSDIGHQREHNEDYFGIQTQIKKRETPLGRTLQARGLYILCDGMGGHAAGEVASAMAVETLQRYFDNNWHEELPTEAHIRESVNLANQEIYNINQENAYSGSGRMGTTLAMILIENTKVMIAHVGDSRIYRLTRKRGLEQVTVDHEVGQREINRGVEPEIAYSRPDAYQLTQALGPRGDDFINPDVKSLELNEDTLFILCSDGLSDNDLIENYWQTHLAPLLSSRANLDEGILKLIGLANEHNGHDNITVLLIRVKVRPNLEPQG